MSHDNLEPWAADLLERFAADPVGMTVRLEDGAEHEVLDLLEGEYGRYLRLDRRRGWVHVSQCTDVIQYQVQLNPAWLADHDPERRGR